MKGTGSLTDIC